jgi:hypothetical protein
VRATSLKYLDTWQSRGVGTVEEGYGVRGREQEEEGDDLEQHMRTSKLNDRGSYEVPCSPRHTQLHQDKARLSASGPSPGAWLMPPGSPTTAAAAQQHPWYFCSTKTVGDGLLPLHATCQPQWLTTTTTTHLHLNGASSRDHLCVLERTPHDHDRVVQGPVGLVNELQQGANTGTSTATDDWGWVVARLCSHKPVSTAA